MASLFGTKLYLRKKTTSMTYTNDANLLSRIEAKDGTVWEDIYEKYAPTMLGAISVFIRNEIVAEKILVETFLELSEKNQLPTEKLKLALYLYIYSFAFTIKKLKAQGINPCVEKLDTYPAIIQQLCKHYDVKELVQTEVYTKEDLKIRANSFCWLPVFGVNPFTKYYQAN